MNDIMLKTYELIDSLEESDFIHKLEDSKNKIENNKEILELLELGHLHQDDQYYLLDIRNKLYQYDDYKIYMECYNELLYLVMDINARIKKLVDNKYGCF